MGRLYYHILSFETSESKKKEKYKSTFDYAGGESCSFTFTRRDYSVSKDIETDDRFINKVFLSGKSIDDESIPSLRLTNTDARIRSYIKDLSKSEKDSFDKAYEKFQNSNKNIKAPLLHFINSSSKAALPLRKIIIQKIVNKPDYSRIPKEYIGTMGYSLDMAQIDTLCRNKFKKFFKEGDLAYKTVRASEATENCLGFSPAVISVTLNKESRSISYYSGVDVIFENHTYHYERYKRSASNARNRQCIYIISSIDGEQLVNEKGQSLKDIMYEWGNCGLVNPYTDPASWEAYTALTLSGIEKNLITLDRKSILLIKDVESVFLDKNCSPIYYEYDNDDETLKVLKSDGGKSKDNLFKINNKIWDGEALIDESVFSDEDNTAYKDAHFMLLRSKFFKSCAFKTRLQKWFSDNGITEVSQLKGFTLADKISDIKLVITESSLKYLKFYIAKKNNQTKDEKLKAGFEAWLKNNSCKRKDADNNVIYSIDFGVVKTDHPSSGKITTSYQYLNSIGITENQAKKITEEVFDTINEYLDIEDPTAFGNYLKRVLWGMDAGISKTDSDDDDIEMLVDNETSGYRDYRYQVASISRLIELSKDSVHLQVYKDFLADQVEKMVEQLKTGQITIDGLYATLFGNPAEYLYATIYDFATDEKSTYSYYVDGNKVAFKPLNKEYVYCRKFENGEKLVGARYPHITMGNLLVTKNKREKNSFYETYFDLGEEIVCVNSIGSNILQQLNGADFDSDTVMLTNNTIIHRAADNQKNFFRIPVNQIEEVKTLTDSEPGKSSEDEYINYLINVDNKLNGSYLGEVVNLASYLNGEFWAKYPVESWIKDKIKTPDNLGNDAEKLYDAICCLAVLSGVVIDSAKRGTRCNIYKEKEIARTLKLKSRIIGDGDSDNPSDEPTDEIRFMKEVPKYYREAILKEENERHQYVDLLPHGKNTINKYRYSYLLSGLSEECIKFAVFDTACRKLGIYDNKPEQIREYFTCVNNGTEPDELKENYDRYEKIVNGYENELNNKNKYYSLLNTVMNMSEEEYKEFVHKSSEKIEKIIEDVFKYLKLDIPPMEGVIFGFTVYNRSSKKVYTYKPLPEDEQHSFMGYIYKFVTEEENKPYGESRLKKLKNATWEFRQLFVDTPPEENLTDKEKEKMSYILELIVEAQMYCNEMQHDIRKGFDVQYENVASKVANLRNTIRDYFADDKKVAHKARFLYELIQKVDSKEYSKCRSLLIAMILDEKIMTDKMKGELICIPTEFTMQ